MAKAKYPKKQTKIAIVLITKNEEQNIESMIGRIRNAGFSDLYVVDEHSEDTTEKIARSKNVKVYQRKGKGFGCGIMSALDIANKKGYDYIVRLDCDGTYDPDDIKKLIEFCPEYDLISSYRGFRNIKTLHRYPNMFFTYLTNLLFLANVRDLNSGMKAINVKKFKDILDAPGFDLEAQLSLRAIKRGYRMKNVKINFTERTKGRSNIKISDGVLILKRIIKERFMR